MAAPTFHSLVERYLEMWSKMAVSRLLSNWRSTTTLASFNLPVISSTSTTSGTQKHNVNQVRTDFTPLISVVFIFLISFTFCRFCILEVVVSINFREL